MLSIFIFYQVHFCLFVCFIYTFIDLLLIQKEQEEKAQQTRKINSFGLGGINADICQKQPRYVYLWQIFVLCENKNVSRLPGYENKVCSLSYTKKFK